MRNFEQTSPLSLAWQRSPYYAQIEKAIYVVVVVDSGGEYSSGSGRGGGEKEIQVLSWNWSDLQASRRPWERPRGSAVVITVVRITNPIQTLQSLDPFPR